MLAAIPPFVSGGRFSPGLTLPCRRGENALPMTTPAVSFVVPCYNERENLPRLFAELFRVIDEQQIDAEVVIVDDGSRDGSFDVLAEHAGRDARVKVIRFRRNFGQTAAMVAGIDHARGEVLVLLDADLQNDPADVPRLLAKINEGYDVVSGWRKDRKDKMVTRRLPSMMANWIISRISGVRLHDYGCTLKAYRRSALEGVTLYGEMHRFIPIYASWTGGKVTEMVVNHRPRVAGVSKYGLGRTFKVILDLITVKFLGTYSTKPIYFFGGFGLVLFLLSFAAAGFALYQKLADGVYVHRNPVATLAVLLFIVGVQLILMGLLAELLIRIYHESQGKRTYLIAKTINLDKEPTEPKIELRDAGGG
jgi:glycosyltransferase involved in cell wall biosynthesis